MFCLEAPHESEAPGNAISIVAIRYVLIDPEQVVANVEVEADLEGSHTYTGNEFANCQQWYYWKGPLSPGEWNSWSVGGISLRNWQIEEKGLGLCKDPQSYPYNLSNKPLREVVEILSCNVWIQIWTDTVSQKVGKLGENRCRVPVQPQGVCSRVREVELASSA